MVSAHQREGDKMRRFTIVIFMAALVIAGCSKGNTVPWNSWAKKDNSATRANATPNGDNVHDAETYLNLSTGAAKSYFRLQMVSACIKGVTDARKSAQFKYVAGMDKNLYALSHAVTAMSETMRVAFIGMSRPGGYPTVKEECEDLFDTWTSEVRKLFSKGFDAATKVLTIAAPWWAIFKVADAAKPNVEQTQVIPPVINQPVIIPPVEITPVIITNPAP